MTGSVPSLEGRRHWTQREDGRPRARERVLGGHGTCWRPDLGRQPSGPGDVGWGRGCLLHRQTQCVVFVTGSQLTAAGWTSVSSVPLSQSTTHKSFPSRVLGAGHRPCPRRHRTQTRGGVWALTQLCREHPQQLGGVTKRRGPWSVRTGVRAHDAVTEEWGTAPRRALGAWTARVHLRVSNSGEGVH